MINFIIDFIFDITKPIYVYKNLNRKCYSIKQNNKVIGYGEHFLLKDCKFVVRKSGRELVIRTKQKNVHAFVKGYIANDIKNFTIGEKIVYNPYLHDYFFYEKNESCKIFSENLILFTNSGIFSCKEK